MANPICAISTTTGIGAISIIRCSGDNVIQIVNSIFKGKNLEKVESHTINYGHIIFNNEIIDEVLVTIMKSPKSFTMEDIVEINSHGGPTTTNKILQILLQSGCTLAEPGEFTKRAFLNGRIDLVEAEAISDLISSETEKARKLAINQITGELSEKINTIRKHLINIQANIEVNIDYPEYEEGEDYTIESIMPHLESIKNELEALVNTSENGKIVKNGINVALLGKPNVGKSSILNKLTEEEKAIVTDIPGTTRDIVEGKIVLNGITINLIDTAGIRQTDDVVEKIGVEKSLKKIKDSDLVIYVIENGQIIDAEDLKIINNIKNKTSFVFINKNDNKKAINYSLDIPIVYGNTIDEDGLKPLKDKIISLYNLNKMDNSDFIFLSNARQTYLIKESLNTINSTIDKIGTLPLDIFTIDIRKCYDLLGEVIGKTYKDDLLDELFSKFCLGK